MLQHGKLLVAGKAVLRQLVVATLVLVSITGQAAHQREQHRRVPAPHGRVAGPNVFEAVGGGQQAGELGPVAGKRGAALRRAQRVVGGGRCRHDFFGDRRQGWGSA